MAKGKKTGGRKPGSTNKTPKPIKELAAEHTPEALDEILRLMREAQNETTRLAAARDIIDRAYGKPTQSVEQTGKDGGPIQLVEIVRFVRDKTAVEQLAAPPVSNGSVGVSTGRRH